ncbi:uncharacterized protein LOC111023338 [Momordica charantia]|uniref:Uncharacterized protein LOC111023338 n=1 Tax=Momordica charantia TaxID=3673 RepID=A0A6J1DS35_MOMCH|nr:uncharacterized protein LOC111023338 [Momordica charantia]
MASAWVKSLQCKSRAFEDVYHPSPKNLIPSGSCRKGVQSLKDVVETTAKSKKAKRSPPPVSRNPRAVKSEPGSSPCTRPRMSVSSRPMRANDFIFPALSELPEGHHSRSVVEIIFHTSWSPKAFAGRVEMIFKVQNGSKTVARFEEYREMVKARAATGSPADEENARCAADGNEVMRFHCMGPTSDCAKYDGCGGGGAWTFPGMKGSAICTFAGSGSAHEKAGGGRGRRAMLVCRVIAGRVTKHLKIDSFLEGRVGLDSVSGENGELLVFDSRAVLPCFLIIYKL